MREPGSVRPLRRAVHLTRDRRWHDAGALPTMRDCTQSKSSSPKAAAPDCRFDLAAPMDTVIGCDHVGQPQLDSPVDTRRARPWWRSPSSTTRPQAELRAPATKNSRWRVRTSRIERGAYPSERLHGGAATREVRNMPVKRAPAARRAGGMSQRHRVRVLLPGRLHHHPPSGLPGLAVESCGSTVYAACPPGHSVLFTDADWLCQGLVHCPERGATPLTANRVCGQWAHILDADVMLSPALLGCVLNHVQTAAVEGKARASRARHTARPEACGARVATSCQRPASADQRASDRSRTPCSAAYREPAARRARGPAMSPS